MLLNNLKIKSVLRNTQQAVNSRVLSTSSGTIKTVAIVSDCDEAIVQKLTKKISKAFNLKSNDVEVRTYQERLSKEQITEGAKFNEKSIGWNGRPKPESLKNFVYTPFNVLVHYSSSESWEQDAMVAQSKAQFKVGITTSSLGLHDLTIIVAPDDVDIFASELMKYLKILNIQQ